jgi:hypothetical protein
MSHQAKSAALYNENWVTLYVHRLTSVSQTNGILRHKCHRISIIHCLSVTTMSHQVKSAAQMLQNFHYIPYLGMEKGRVTLFISDYNVKPSEICSTNVAEFSLYSLFGDGEGQGYTVCMWVNICQSNHWNSVARMSQNFHHTLYISDCNVSPMEICGMIVTEFSIF